MPYNLNIPGFMSIRDLQVIESLAERVPEKGIIIEIGSFMGRSSWTFAKSTHSSVKVYCIDCWGSFEMKALSKPIMAGYQEGMTLDFNVFKSNVKDCPNIIPIKGLSTQVNWPKNKKADLIFIDASHKSPDVESDLNYWFRYLKNTGTICGHDFDIIKFPDVCRAVIALSEQLNLPIKFFKGSTVWAIEQPSNSFIKEETFVSNALILEEIKQLLL